MCPLTLTCSFRVPKTENCQTLVVTMDIACHIKLSEKLTLFYLLLSQVFIHRLERLRIGGICFPFKDEYKDEPKLPIYPKTLFGTIHTFLFTYETLVMATLITFGALCVASMLQILHHLNYPPPPQ
jgi:hypothetical protein